MRPPEPRGWVPAAPPPPPPPPPPLPPPPPPPPIPHRQRGGLGGALLAAALALLLLASLVLVGLLPNPFGPGSPRSEWAFSMTQADDLNARGLLGRGIVICVVDTGIEPNHPDLRGTHLLAWFDAIAGEKLPYDDAGHGTAMAGIVAGNGTMKGVAPEASLMVAKAIAADGSGESTTVAVAIRWCADPNGDGDFRDGADIISLSLGGAAPRGAMDEANLAAEEATAHGILVFAAAGNDGQRDDGDVQIPAAVAPVIAVGAVDRNGIIAPFSSRGNNGGRVDPDRKPEVVAPGVSITTPWRNGERRVLSGTSVATALAAGTAALLLQAAPGYRHGSGATVEAFKVALMRGAEKLDAQATPHDDRYGYGLLAALAVLARL